MRILNEKGISSLMAAGIMVILSLMGFAVASLVTTSRTIHVEQLYYDRAFYVTQAGLEYAMRKIYEAVSPVVAEPGINFGGGYFTIARQDRLITVTGHHGDAQVVHSLTSPSHADCTNFDLSSANLSGDGKKMSQIHFEKICLEQTVIDKVRISWTNPGSEGFKKMKIESQTVYDNPAVASGNLTDIANYIMNGNNQNNVNAIEFNQNMTGKTFTIDFLMGDASSESYTFTP